MKISRNWLKNYIISNKSNEDLSEIFTQLGLECTVNEIIFNLENVVVGKVLSCKKHPDADRLKVCKVDVGKEKLNIICGAPNISSDINVPVALVGAKLMEGKVEIKKTKIRGVQSNGMICSSKELGLNDDHGGIMILSDKFKKGQNLSDSLLLENDNIFDFDITPNRGDCFSHLGIARELSVIENKKINIPPTKFSTSKFKTSDLIKVNIKDQGICYRYSCRIIKNVTVKESPQWLKNKLHSIGQNSVNNIVDMANYIMFDLGQPLHTFDYDKISGKEVNVRYAKQNEKIICLNNDTKKLSDKDIIISDKKNPIAIAGVIGGLNSHVDKNTKNILIESALFNEICIRKTAKKHDYSKESSKRFERGIDYNNVVLAMDKYIELLNNDNKVDISSDYIDIEFEKPNIGTVIFSVDECNGFLGTSLTLSECQKIFKKLSIDYTLNKKNIKCKIPSFRNDISREVDLFEEIARVYGYDNIPSNDSFSISSNCFVKDDLYLESNIRTIMSSNGYNEHYSNSLYSELDVQINSKSKPVELLNPLSQDMKYLRNDLLPGLLKSISYNEKRGHEYLKLFEIGSVINHDSEKYNFSDEKRQLGIIWSLNKKSHWKYPLSNDIYTVKGEIKHLFDLLNYHLDDFIYKDDSFKIMINELLVGECSLINNEILKKYDIKNNLLYCCLYLDEINNVEKTKKKFNHISNFPSINRDISILINKKITNQKIENNIKKEGTEFLKEINLFDIYKDSNASDDNQALAYSFTFSSDKRTLTDKEIDKIMNNILSSLSKNFDAVQR